MLDATAAALVDYVAEQQPDKPAPTLGEAASVVLDEWHKHRLALGRHAEQQRGPVQVRPVEIEG